MILPKLVSIDTSIFGDIAKDYYSGNSVANERARSVVSYLTNNGFIPFISFHHVQEILQHQDRNVVFNRWSLINKFPCVAWLCAYEDDENLGSCVDLHKIEVINILKNQKADLRHFVDEVKSKYIKYSSGKEFVERFESLYCQLQDVGAIDPHRAKEIESICHVVNKELDDTKLSMLNESALRNPKDALSHLKKFQAELSGLLMSHGDSKLNSPAKVAKGFVEEVAQECSGLYSAELPLYDLFVKKAGVRMDQVSSKTTIGQLGYLGIYNKKMSILLQALDIPKQREMELSPSQQIMWVMWEHFDKAMKYENAAHGSNMADKEMGPLSLFVDIFTVDKRVNEYFRQLTRKHTSLSDCLGRVVKLSSYSDFTKVAI